MRKLIFIYVPKYYLILQIVFAVTEKISNWVRKIILNYSLYVTTKSIYKSGIIIMVVCSVL